MRWILLLLFLSAGYQAAAAAKKSKAEIVITADLRHNVLWVDKYSIQGHVRLNTLMLPVVKESFHAGQFRPTHIYRNYRRVGSRTYLENVIFFSGTRQIRTTRKFREQLQEQRPKSGVVMLDPDFGNFLYSAVERYGLESTRIRVLK